MTKTLSRTLIICAAAILLAVGAGNASAALTQIASGTLSVAADTLTLTRANNYDTDWADATLHWSVNFDEAINAFVYQYTFDKGVKYDVSYMAVETSENFTQADLLFGTSPDGEVGDFDQNTSPAGIDGMADMYIFGVKFENEDDDNPFVATIVTQRIPVWGDIFLKDGQVDAVNSGYFDADPTDPVAGFDLTQSGYLAVPDTQSVPIPPALLLMGSGLMGLVVARRRTGK